MNNSETIKVLTKFYNVISSTTPDNEDKEYVRYFNLKIAEAIIRDMGHSEAIRIANTILSTVDETVR